MTGNLIYIAHMLHLRTKSFIIGTPAVLFLLVGFGFWYVGHKTSERADLAAPIGELRIALSPTIDSAPIYVAQHNGYFENLGVEAILLPHETGRQSLEDVLSDKADLATASDVAFVMKSFKNPGLRVLSTLEDDYVVDLIARKDRSIEVPEDLKGKRIGVVKGGSSEFFLTVFLAKNGLTTSDVRLVSMLPGDMEKALERDVVDAVSIWDPYAFSVQGSLGENAVRWSTKDEQPLFFLLVSSEKTLKLRAKIIERFLRAVTEAEVFIKTHPLEAKAIVEKELVLDPSYSDAIWPDYAPRVALPQELLLILEDEARWLVRGSSTQKGAIPNYLNFLYFEGLERVKPDSVTVIH